MLTAVLIGFSSCDSDDSVSDMFEEANGGDVAQNLIAQVTVESNDPTEADRNITVNYASDNSVTSVNDGVDTAIFSYEGGALSQVTGSGDALNIMELYEAPLDAFEIGEVLSYDSNNNPSLLSLVEEEFDGTLTFYEATITYDSEPNPTFYTLQAAGIIEVLDQTELSFSMIPDPAEIVLARMLYPLNNPNGMVIRDESGAVVVTMSINHVYNDDDYPTSSTVTIDSTDDGASAYVLTYTYR